jgi:hypothetical protein
MVAARRGHTVAGRLGIFPDVLRCPTKEVLVMAGKADEYRHHAQECLEAASRINSEEERSIYST